jgi:drug/metabolite transporter (DMT)-like permease
MTYNRQFKGYSLALLATVAGSTVYIFSKSAFEQVTLSQFGVYWFAFALFWNYLYALVPSRTPKLHRIATGTHKKLVAIGLLELVATTAFYAAIQLAVNPAIPSFLRNMEYIFVTLLGVFLLHEKLSKKEAAGAALTFLGAMVISYNKGASPGSYFTGTSGLMLVSTVFYGFRTIMIKSNIHHFSPTVLAINRAFYLLAFSLITLVFLKQSLVIPWQSLINIAIGSFLGPFITSIGQYSALKHIEATRLAIIQSTTALFVLIGALLIFGRFPVGYQLIGGALTIAGPMWLILGKRRGHAKSGK